MTVNTASEWAEAMDAARRASSARPAESVPLAVAVGRVLARAVTAAQDIPHFASSAMDGWAVAGRGPWHVSAPPLTEGQACEIVTGAPLPEGATGILRAEWGSTDAGRLHRTIEARADEPGHGSHVRPPASEAAEGEELIAAGTRLTPAHIAVAAIAGHDQLVVTCRPTVTVLLTGDEIDDAGIPKPGRVRDVFGPQLPSLVGMLGAEVIATVRVSDSRGTTVSALSEASAGSDLILTTGGTGRSAVDHIRPALDELSATLLITGLAVRPGGPTLLARLPDGTLVVGVPGNPLAAMMGLALVARPAIEGLLGMAECPAGEVVAGADLASGKAVALVPYRMTPAGAVPAERISAAMMRGLADADGILVIPTPGVRQGERVASLPLPWSTGRTT